MHGRAWPSVATEPVGGAAGGDRVFVGSPLVLRRRWVAPVAVGAAYLLLTCIFYGEGVRHLASHYISDGGDGADFLWLYWHIPRAIAHGHNPFASDLIFWPVGVRMAFHTTTPLEALLAVPLSAVFGHVLGVNLLQIAAIPLTAVSAYRLALHQCGDRRIAFFAGAAFAFIAQHQGRMFGHWNLNHFEVLPFALLALLRV